MLTNIREMFVPETEMMPGKLTLNAFEKRSNVPSSKISKKMRVKIITVRGRYLQLLFKKKTLLSKESITLSNKPINWDVVNKLRTDIEEIKERMGYLCDEHKKLLKQSEAWM